MEPGEALPIVITALELQSLTAEPGGGGGGEEKVVQGMKLRLFLSLDLKEKAGEKTRRRKGEKQPGARPPHSGLSSLLTVRFKRLDG